jgi:hypothetical protein
MSDDLACAVDSFPESGIPFVLVVFTVMTELAKVPRRIDKTGTTSTCAQHARLSTQIAGLRHDCVNFEQHRHRPSLDSTRSNVTTSICCLSQITGAIQTVPVCLVLDAPSHRPQSQSSIR